MYDSAAQNAQEYATEAINNIKAVTAAMGGGDGGASGYIPIRHHYNSSGGGIAGGSANL